MDTSSKTDVLPAPPSLMNALTAGFDAVTRHLALLLLPAALDIFLVFGPHLRLTKLMGGIADRFKELITPEGVPGASQLALLDPEVITAAAERLNIISVLRTYPVGIPSLMAARFPAEAPAVQPAFFEIESVTALILIVVGLLFIGFVLGSFYFISVSQAALYRKLDLRTILTSWPRASLQVLLLALFCAALFIGITIPATCVLTGLTLGGNILSQLGVLLYFATLLWVAIPLLLSAHGIFVFGDSMLASVRRSAQVTRMTLPTTSLLFIAIMLLSQGLDVIWSSGNDGSWISMVGIAGHAFISTALLATSFIYFRDADKYVHLLIAQLKIKSARTT